MIMLSITVCVVVLIVYNSSEIHKCTYSQETVFMTQEVLFLSLPSQTTVDF